MTSFFVNVSKVEVSETSRKSSCMYILQSQVSDQTKVSTPTELSLAIVKKKKTVLKSDCNTNNSCDCWQGKVNDSAAMGKGYRLKCAAISTNPLIMIRLLSLQQCERETLRKHNYFKIRK